MLGSSLAVGAVCCARHHLAFTLRAVLRELFTISVCVRFADRHFFVPTSFINRWPVFMLPSSRNCYATTGLEGSVCVWGLRPMPTTKGAPSSPCTPHSITAFVFMSTCLPCLLVRRFLFRVPPIPATAATYRQQYRRYRQQYRRYGQHHRCYWRRRRSDRCCRPPASRSPLPPPPLPPLLRRWQPPPTATAALPLPTSPTVAASAIVAVPPSPLPSAGMSCAAVCVTPDDSG